MFLTIKAKKTEQCLTINQWLTWLGFCAQNNNLKAGKKMT
jgi:hypothetical protein